MNSNGSTSSPFFITQGWLHKFDNNYINVPTVPGVISLYNLYVAGTTKLQNATINNNTIINNNFNLRTPNEFGKEDISYIPESNYDGMLQNKFMAIEHLNEKIHFDVNHPENHNVFISNIRGKYAYVFKEGKWVIENKEDGPRFNNIGKC